MFSPERPQIPGTSSEVPQEERREGWRLLKAERALIAIGGAILWGEWKALNTFDPLGVGGLSEKEEKQVQEKGWLRTMAEKASSFYRGIGKVEDAVEAARAGKWDDILGGEGGKANAAEARE